MASACANFHTVEDARVYRCAQPDPADFRAWVESYDIRTVVQLRRMEPPPESRALIQEAEIELVRIPISARVYPSRTQLVQLWDAFAQARYPVLIHCRAGADRTGLAAAIYVLQRTGDLDRARAELALAYGHTGWGTNRLDRVFEMYGRWHGRMDFRRWASTLYHPPRAYAASESQREPAPQPAQRAAPAPPASPGRAAPR
jgi:protein tyrosine/serine phosphatase